MVICLVLLQISYAIRMSLVEFQALLSLSDLGGSSSHHLLITY